MSKLATFLPLLLIVHPVLTKPHQGSVLADFSCPEPHGYFKHSNQCEEYVECKNYVPITLSCPKGLHFNPRKQWIEYPCDYPANVQCIPQPTIITTTSPPRTPPTTAAPVVIAPHEFTCPQPHGYFNHADQCEQYVECKNNVPRTYACPSGLQFNPEAQWTEYPCDHPSRVQCNKQRVINKVVTTTPRPPPPTTTKAPVVIAPRDFSCPQPHGYFKQADQCEQYVECKNNVPRTYSCPAGLQFNPDARWTEYPCEHPSVVNCKKQRVVAPIITTTPRPPPPPSTPAPVVVAPREFSCPQPHGYFKHADQCEQYVECKNNVPQTYSCPTGLHFNPEAQWTEYPCEQPSRVQCNKQRGPPPITTTPRPPPPPTTPAPVVTPHEFSCPQPHGYYKKADHCGEYIECKNNVPRTYACPAGFQFNPQVQWTEYPCDHPSIVQCNNQRVSTTTPVPLPPTTPAPIVVAPREFSCPQPHGYFKHADQCDQYVECKNNTPRTYSCPTGHHFNPKADWTEYPCEHASKVPCNK